MNFLNFYLFLWAEMYFKFDRAALSFHKFKIVHFDLMMVLRKCWNVVANLNQNGFKLLILILLLQC